MARKKPSKKVSKTPEQHAEEAGFTLGGAGREVSTAEGAYRLECPRCYAVKRMHSRPPIWPTQCDECHALISEPADVG